MFPLSTVPFQQVGKRVAECGGAALIVDYGEEQGEEVGSSKEGVENSEEKNLGNAEDKFGNANEKEGQVKRIERDTLRAFRHHKQVHPLVCVTF